MLSTVDNNPGQTQVWVTPVCLVLTLSECHQYQAVPVLSLHLVSSLLGLQSGLLSSRNTKSVPPPPTMSDELMIIVDGCVWSCGMQQTPGPA